MQGPKYVKFFGVKNWEFSCFCLWYRQGPATNSAVPFVCKKSLYADFKQLLHKSDCVADITYYEAKQSARTYQEAKTSLYESISARGYGDWIKKPVEIDYFC